MFALQIVCIAIGGWFIGSGVASVEMGKKNQGWKIACGTAGFILYALFMILGN